MSRGVDQTIGEKPKTLSVKPRTPKVKPKCVKIIELHTDTHKHTDYISVLYIRIFISYINIIVFINGLKNFNIN